MLINYTVYSADAKRKDGRKQSRREGKTRSHAKKVLFSQRKESSEATPTNAEEPAVPPLFTRENTFVSINEEGQFATACYDIKNFKSIMGLTGKKQPEIMRINSKPSFLFQVQPP